MATSTRITVSMTTLGIKPLSPIVKQRDPPSPVKPTHTPISTHRLLVSAAGHLRLPTQPAPPPLASTDPRE
jgi:hypothetical protein